MLFYKKILLALIFLFSLQAIFADNYLLPPNGRYGISFQDIQLVNGTLINGKYSCPGNTDLLYASQYQQDYGKDNQVDFCREIMVRVYYPILQPSKPSTEKYYSPAIADLQTMIRAGQVPGITPDDINALSQITTFSWNNLSIVPQTFPVIFFVPGASMEAQQYENNITELVSRGYIVLAINNTFVGSSILFPDGRLVHYRSDLPKILPKADQSVFNDILFVRNSLIQRNSPLSQFLPFMQLNSIGLMGHSMGGISVIAMIRQHPSLFQAAVSLDALPTKLGTRIYSSDELAGLSIPTMRLFAAEWRNLGGIVTPPDAHFQLLQNNYYSLLSPSESDITYTGHMSLSDLATLQYATAISLYLKYSDPTLVGYANGWHTATLLNNYVDQFFDQYLKNIPSSNLQSCVPFAQDSMLNCG